MATTITVMHDTQTHAVVMVNADGGNAVAQPGVILLTSLVGAQLNAFGGASVVPPRVAITKIESSCGPGVGVNAGYTIDYGGNGGLLFIHEGSLKLDDLNLIMSTPGNIVVTPQHNLVSFTAILTLKKIKGFAGSASMAKIG